MSYEKDIIKKGKHLAWLLRHDKKSFEDGKIDKFGWRLVSELIKEHGYTQQMLIDITDTNDKKRYEFNNDMSKIRARQGHSISVDVCLEEVVPPEFLYHGTATRFLSSIYKNGIIKGTRLHVHLSKDYNTAIKVGERHGIPYVITIKAKEMYDDGYKFYLSNNGVYLTDYVNTKYFTKYKTIPSLENYINENKEL